jgi:hypothetical protein
MVRRSKDLLSSSAFIHNQVTFAFDCLHQFNWIDPLLCWGVDLLSTLFDSLYDTMSDRHNSVLHRSLNPSGHTTTTCYVEHLSVWPLHYAVVEIRHENDAILSIQAPPPIVDLLLFEEELHTRSRLLRLWGIQQSNGRVIVDQGWIYIQLSWLCYSTQKRVPKRESGDGLYLNYISQTIWVLSTCNKAHPRDCFVYDSVH